MNVDYNSLIPLGNEGEVTVAVVENAAQDSNGNGNAYASNTLKIDRKAPILVSLESYANSNIKLDSDVDSVKQYYKAGETVTIVATFTENIKGENVSDTEKLPTLSLTFSESGNANGSVSAGRKEGNKIIYTYEITNKDLGTLSVKGFTGKVIDAAGNETVVTKRELTGDTIIADTVAPELVGITAIAPDFEYDELIQTGETKRYGVKSKTRENNTITIVAEYSENVYSLNSNTISKITTVPELKIKFGTGAQRTISTGEVEGNKITYTYNIQAEDNGNLSIVSLKGTVSDIAGNTLTTSTTLPTTAKYETEAVQGNEVENITADTTPVQITFTDVTPVNYDDNGNVITGNGNYYRKGAVITVTAETNEYVYKNTNKSLERFTTDNAPNLNVSFATSGTGKGQALCTNVEYVDNKTVFTYTYTVKVNDNGQLSLNIAENLGYDIALNANNEKSETKDIYTDTVNPVTNWQSWVEGEGYGIKDLENGTWEVTFSEKLYVYDNANYTVGNELSNSNKEKAPILLVSKDNTTALETTITDITTKTINDISKTVITYQYADYTKNIGAYGMKFASVSDKSGNLFNLKDQVAPKLEKIEVTSPATGIYKAGEVITIVATFNEKLNEESTAPTLELAFTDSGDAKGSVSQGNISGNTITYTYTITANDNKGDGDTGLLHIKSFAGNGLLDLSDNEWVEENNKSLSGSAITADTTAPVITKVEAKVGDEVIGSYGPDLEAGKTNADTICYVVTFSEDITLINKDEIEITNGKITEVKQESDKVINVTVKTTTEGVQSLIIPAETVADKAQAGGNKNEFFRFNGITVDFTKPTVRFISEYNGGVYVLPTGIGKIEIRPNVEINEDISKIEYNWNNDIDAEYVEINKYSGASDIVIPTKEFTEAGEYTLRVKVTDIAGNITKASKEYTVLSSGINITAKNEGIAEDATNKLPPVNGDVLVTVEFEEGLTDNRKVFFKSEGSNEYREINPETNYYRIKENGTVYAEATDKVGNKVFYLHEEKVGDEVTYEAGYPITNIDRIAPTIEFSEVPYGILKSQPIEIEISTNEEADIKYSWDNENWETYQEKIVKTFETSGNHILYAKATDAAGNETEIYNLEIYVSELEFEVLGNIDYWTAEDIVLYVISESNIASIKVNGKELASGEREYLVQENGEYEFVVTDEYGNPATTTVIVDKIDKDAPQIDEEATTISGNDVTIEAEDVGSGIAEYAISTTTEVPVKWSNDKTINTTEDGIFYLWVKDNVGNVGRSIEPVVIDTVALEIEVTGNPTEWTNKDVELVIKANKELSSLKIGETEIENSRYLVTENGEYVLTATDIYGKPTTMTITVNKIDKVLPEVDEEGTTISGREITIVATDDDSEIAGYAISTTTEVPVEWWQNNVIKTTEDGMYYVWAKDNAGNVNIGDKVVVVDTAAPIVSFSYLPQIVTVGMPFETTVFTNEDAIISYSWDNKNWVDSEEFLRSLPVSKETVATGRYLLYVKATDVAGNTSEVQTISFEVVTMEEVKQPDIIFEDIPVVQIDGVRYIKVSSGMTVEMLKDYINEAALYGKTPEFTKLTEDEKLRTGSEISLNGSLKYIVVVEGDINCDGKVTFDDIIKTNAVRISSGENNITKAQLLAADIDNTAKIEFKDIISINAIRINSMK